MIQIQQDKAEVTNLDTLLLKHGEKSIKIDVDSLKNDIEVLREKMNNPLSKADKKNMYETKKYLQNTLNFVEDSSIEFMWNVDKYIIKTYPVNLLSIPEYSIEMSDYIIPKEGYRLLRLDYTHIFELIAIEMMYKDFDETLISMEEKLCNLGITGIYPYKELKKHFADDNMLNLSRILKIGASAYCLPERKVAFEYFGKQEFSDKYYKDCVGYSVKHASALITQQLLEKVGSNNLKAKLACVNDSGIYFIVKDDVDIESSLVESATVRVFGRRFEVKPNVTLY